MKSAYLVTYTTYGGPTAWKDPDDCKATWAEVCANRKEALEMKLNRFPAMPKFRSNHNGKGKYGG